MLKKDPIGKIIEELFSKNWEIVKFRDMVKRKLNKMSTRNAKRITETKMQENDSYGKD